MRMRLGIMIGFGIGYLRGAKAGRERYEQLMASAGRFWQSPKVEQFREKATEVVGQATDMVTHNTVKLDDDDLPELLSPYEATINPPAEVKEHI